MTLALTGTGDVLEPENGVMAIGSGGNYALAAARALIDTDADAETIARKAMQIAAEICVYTNHNVVVETHRCRLNGATATASGRSREEDLPMLAALACGTACR